MAKNLEGGSGVSVAGVEESGWVAIRWKFGLQVFVWLYRVFCDRIWAVLLQFERRNEWILRRKKKGVFMSGSMFF